MERFFNTTGPIQADMHYHLPVQARLAASEIMQLIDRRRYFILHAPRQVGKTSALLGLRDELNAGGRYDCIYLNIEGAQGYREQIGEVLKCVISTLSTVARTQLRDAALAAKLKAIAPHSDLRDALTLLSESREKPVVVLVDEIDSIIGDSLVTILRQLRSGYESRPAVFPVSVVLCGVRDIKDYRIHRDAGDPITGGSCFNISADSIRMPDFDEADLRALYAQHTEATGQVFEEGALALAWYYTQGQPWLVNALADECCFQRAGTRDRSVPITRALMDDAKERLVRKRAVHLDQLADKLKEPRVRRVIEPMLLGIDDAPEATSADYEYVHDLGLIRDTPNGMVVANPIYREIIPRQLTSVRENSLKAIQRSSWYIRDDNTLDMHTLLSAFQQFFRENAESWVQRFDYLEAGPQLLLQAFLQRVVNGGGRIDREYALGRMRTDLLVRWPTTDAAHHGPVERFVLELKLLHKTREQTIEAGLQQTAEYMRRQGVSEGHLVIFDRREDVSWDEKIYRREEKGPAGEPIIIWGC